MSFFISDALKSRVSEDDLSKSDDIDSSSFYNKEELLVLIKTVESNEHSFDFLCFKQSKETIQIDLKVPMTYKFLGNILNAVCKIKIANLSFVIFEREVQIDNFDLISQSDRNYYILKIFIKDLSL